MFHVVKLFAHRRSRVLLYKTQQGRAFARFRDKARVKNGDTRLEHIYRLQSTTQPGVVRDTCVMCQVFLRKKERECGTPGRSQDETAHLRLVICFRFVICARQSPSKIRTSATYISRQKVPHTLVEWILQNSVPAVCGVSSFRLEIEHIGRGSLPEGGVSSD